ncbi:helix-turn-helix domain-containing protein [Chryseobacterium taklimakanense]|uniref:DNA-binding protein n=1 Tax=Chryseobacterium taklimakanense TaxID=536441 RepID=A0A3G8WF51_9FLAO|nr:helix-turn-helix domain-containing protein [Chryseobacterium taklimakanense]AZI19765.1 DNA-binding protein [Chryseobacterium taklimakanense]
MEDQTSHDGSLRDIVEALKGLLQKAADDDTGYYDASDVKQMLNICDKTLYRWRQQKLIRYEKMRGKYFYPKKSVRQLRTRRKRK